MKKEMKYLPEEAMILYSNIQAQSKIGQEIVKLSSLQKWIIFRHGV